MTEEISWTEYATVLNGANDMRFDYVWNEELFVYECEQDAAQLDMRFDVQWEGHCWQYLWENKQAAERKRGCERVVTDGEW